MTQDEILDTVKTSIGQVLPDFDPAKVTATATFEALGLGSLHVVEVISKCQRAMKVKVPRGEVAKLKDVAALVDALSRAPAK